MASPAWLSQETQPSTPQTPVSGPFTGGPSGALQNSPSVANTSAASPSHSGNEPTQTISAPRPGYAVPASSFSYSASLEQSGSSSSSAPSSVNKSNTPVPHVASQTPALTQSQSFGSLSYNVSQTGVGYSGSQQHQPTMNNLAPQGAGVVSSSNSLLTSPPSLGSMVPPFHMHSNVPGAPGTSASSGTVLSASMSVKQTISSGAMESTSSTVLRPSLPVTPVAAAQLHTYSPNQSLPAMAAPPQGVWFQPPQIGMVPRAPFLSYPASFPNPFPVPAQGMPLPSVSVPDSQPPGVTPVGNMATSSVSGHQLAATTGIQADVVPPGTESNKVLNGASVKNAPSVSEEPDAWTAHRTETGVIYYYNAVTGESTYEKPPGFKGEPDRVPVQPTPVSMDNLTGTDWALVTTTDGRKYYYNSKTKISSWQIPTEVSELRKKQEAEAVKENSATAISANALDEKGSAQATLCAPAVNTGGRDAISLRTSGVAGSPSALDLIKKKLQDSGTPVTQPIPSPSGAVASENNSKTAETVLKGQQNETNKDKPKDPNGDDNLSDTSESDDEDNGPTKEERIVQFKEMLKERGVAPFSKWEKELPKIIFDPRFKAIPSYSARRALFEHYVKTRAEEERKEKRAAQKAAIEGFRQLLDEASEDIDHNTDYPTFKKKWGNDPRFEALDRKEGEALLNERVLPLKKAAEAKTQAMRTAAVSSFKAMLKERADISINSRWSKVKDSLRNDPRYKSIKHEEREALFNGHISELKVAAAAVEREAKSKRDEQDKLKERERELRKRKEREEQEMERVRLKVRRKEAVSSFQALLVETIKDPQASWTESKLKLEKDPQGRAANPDLDPSDMEKLFRDHVKMLHERCVNDFKALLAEALTAEAAAQETEDGKTILNSWSTAKRLLKTDHRYNKLPRKAREALWRRYADDMLWRQKSSLEQREEKHIDGKNKSSVDSGRFPSSRRADERR